MYHHKFHEVKTLVNAKVPVLLTGEKGSGKTTLAKQVCETIGIPFYSLSMTRQTTLSHLLGFMSVNGTYVASQLRECATEGGGFLLDELDASDANVILCLNTIENGYISFPDGIVELHKDFRLLATSNPQDQHASYVGRGKLDAATLDRFDIINIDHDDELEKTLIDNVVFSHIVILRKALKNFNSSKVISMRDALRFQKRKELDLLDGFVYRLIGNNLSVYEKYEEAINNMPKFEDQADCVTVEDLYSLIKITKNNTSDETPSPSAPPPPNTNSPF